MITIRPMKHPDIEAGVQLCRAAHWNQLKPDWEMFFDLNPADCRVAISEGKIAGTATIVRYQHSFSWIGMILVDPSLRRQGIGMQLLQEALQILSQEETVKLDATPAGRELYLKLNFVDEYGLNRMILPKVVAVPEATRVKPVRPAELEKIKIFDREIFGADRSPLLEGLYKRAPHYAFWLEEENEIQGYCLGREGQHFTQIGPVIARNIETARELITAALQHCIGKAVGLDIMQDIAGWMDWLASLGFTSERYFVRMYRGKNAFPGIPANQFAIAGPEFG